ncbi:hypothetical protein BJY01DRAFT_251400 [Aspergillus pseudoustus]|uniref:Major facilitator superfamily (MFS) profile domain-containing protein n=1 Tax=Aspergillus pseudoustus TaxID=1810923 RepID=A0ABR4JBY0_9EURO
MVQGHELLAAPRFLEDSEKGCRLVLVTTTKTPSIIGAINSTFSGGAASGALTAGLTIDQLGRRFTIQLGAFIATIGAVLQRTAQDLAMILVGCTVAGRVVGILIRVPRYNGPRATLVSGIYNVVGPIANLIFITFILDRVSRRRPLMFGAGAIAIALVCEAALNSQNEAGTHDIPTIYFQGD